MNLNSEMYSLARQMLDWDILRIKFFCFFYIVLCFFSFSVFVNIKVSAHNLSGLKVLTNISSYKKICPMS